jgi:hypothetical protein
MDPILQLASAWEADLNFEKIIIKDNYINTASFDG